MAVLVLAYCGLRWGELARGRGREYFRDQVYIVGSPRRTRNYGTAFEYLDDCFVTHELGQQIVVEETPQS